MPKGSGGGIWESLENRCPAFLEGSQFFLRNRRRTRQVGIGRCYTVWPSSADGQQADAARDDRRTATSSPAPRRLTIGLINGRQRPVAKTNAAGDDLSQGRCKIALSRRADLKTEGQNPSYR